MNHIYGIDNTVSEEQSLSLHSLICSSTDMLQQILPFICLLPILISWFSSLILVHTSWDNLQATVNYSNKKIKFD